ncbi:hypothetical protein QJS10_CPB17g01511 [Acorus calamus]|uniref:NAC domain-containing protein n=1 Tax=Acorus calamus TaxID=4465 RepID=A0AAV9CW49_ACOCL|nr:hypothetical protein QJS10_CPB17g01511 [Acorus calamus]
MEGILAEMRDNCADLPPGFRFHPTDEEIITNYLVEKVTDTNFTSRAIGDVDLNKCEPWDLPSKAKMGEKEWYFFCQRDRKYPTGMRTNRATYSGYWKATGKDKEIYKGKGVLVGMKKTLVFYRGRAPKGEKTNWVMHEFRLDGDAPNFFNLPRTLKDEWVVCKVFHKNAGIKRTTIAGFDEVNTPLNGLMDSPSSPPLSEPSYNNTNNNYFLNNYNGMNRTSSTINGDELDIKGLCELLQIPGYVPSPPEHPHPKPATQLSKSNPLIPLPMSAGTSYLHQQNPMISSFPSSSSGLIYQNQAALRGMAEATALRRACKVEQYSNHNSLVSASQDTGLSTDRNAMTEISSALTKQELGGCEEFYEDIDGPSPPGDQIANLENMWGY